MPEGRDFGRLTRSIRLLMKRLLRRLSLVFYSPFYLFKSPITLPPLGSLRMFYLPASLALTQPAVVKSTLVFRSFHLTSLFALRLRLFLLGAITEKIRDGYLR